VSGSGGFLSPWSTLAQGERRGLQGIGTMEGEKEASVAKIWGQGPKKRRNVVGAQEHDHSAPKGENVKGRKKKAKPKLDFPARAF